MYITNEFICEKKKNKNIIIIIIMIMFIIDNTIIIIILYTVGENRFCFGLTSSWIYLVLNTHMTHLKRGIKYLDSKKEKEHRYGIKYNGVHSV